jgi:2-dehydro-3-deoxyphosphogluconate aldolase/(4S)-4-hydroxy-2-oxoglutarate aldolase
VSEENLETWFKAGAFAVGMGSSLTKAGWGENDPQAVATRRPVSWRKIARIRKNR